MDKKDELLRINELEQLASEILTLKEKNSQRRPLLIEFCGSPKSGKTTTVNSLNLFLKRNGFKTIVLTECASICPISNKKHPFFNLWTLCSAVAEIVQHLDKEKEQVDIIISDRGIFDSLCWFRWLNRPREGEKPHLSDSDFNRIRQFLELDLWKINIDLIYIFKVAPEISIEREYANLLTKKEGSIMNIRTLSSFNEAIEENIKDYEKHFRRIEILDTGREGLNVDPSQVGYEVTKNVLTILKELLYETIGYIKAEEFTLSAGVYKDIDIINSWHIEYKKRADVENNASWLQPIPIVVITNPERSKVLVCKKRKEDKDSPEKDKLLLYFGGHVRKEDDNSNSEIPNTCSEILKNTLKRELEEEIGDSFVMNDPPEFIIYSTQNPRSSRHIAICYICEDPSVENDKFKITSQEHIMKSGSSKSGHVLSIQDILDKHQDELEDWSVNILEHVFNRQLPRQTFIEF